MLEETKFDNKSNKQRKNDNRNDKSVLNESGVEKKKGSNLHEYEQLSEKAVDLIFNNKINAKNAFDVNVDYLDKLPNLLKRNEETSWQKASASLDASAKIYGFRVDSVHSDTFKFLGGLSRAEKDGENNNEDGPDGEKKENKKSREGRHDGFSTLERDPKKLDLAKYDLEFDVDPLFKMMTIKFGDSGARGLLLKNLPVDSNIDVLLESKEEPTPKISKYANNIQNNPENNEKKDQVDQASNNMIIDEEQPEEDNEKESESKNSEKDPRSITTDIMSIVEKTLNSFSVQDLKGIEICPNLSYFKKSRDIETSLERTFYNDLMHEFDDTLVREHINLDKSHVSDLDNSINLGDNLEMENDYISALSQRSSHGSHLSAKFDENLNMNNMLGNLNSSRNEFNKNIGPGVGVSYMEGFSYLKSDDIKEYIHQFGDGNKEIFKNIPQYKIFTKTFDQLDRFNKFGAGNLLGFGLNNNNNENTNKKRVKKEEMLFEFSVENEVNKNDIFEKESKLKKPIVSKEPARKKYKKKVKQYYHYDRSVLYNLFSIQDRLINNEHESNNIRQQPVENDIYSQPGDDLPSNEEVKNNFAETFVKIDSEYEKKFGRLYKTFDVRVIKSKIWESINFVSPNLEGKEKQLSGKILQENEQVDFKKVIQSVSTNLSKEVLSNISTSTCFVCLLHLCNEKTLKLEAQGQDNFIIKQGSNQD